MFKDPLINPKANLNLFHSAPIVFSTRIRLARNLCQFPFPEMADMSQRREIVAQCSQALRKLSGIKGARPIEIEELSELEKQVLAEKHLISRQFCKCREGSGVVITKDQSCSIMINEEDHLRIQVIRSGFNLSKVWERIDAFDSELEAWIDFAFSPKLGYITACPTNVGTGMRASVMMHLPGLVIANHMEQVIRAVNQLGIVVRGIFGEGSDASGSIFQISNQQTLGESEEAILKRLKGVLNTVIDQEYNARQKLLAQHKSKLFDKIGRAYGILKNTHLISSEEAMNLLSLIRLGVDFNLLSEEYRSTLDRLFIESQPGHIQLNVSSQKEGDNVQLDADQRDNVRACLIREAMASFSPIDFKNATATANVKRSTSHE